MQAAHWSSNWVALPVAPPAEELPLLDGLVLGEESPPPLELLELLAGRLATAGAELDPPLHAASPIAAAETRKASPPSRRYVLVISRLPGSRDASR
jgi:hypothetical protein